jgi:ABC-type branched-subunit amino acid transport system substrate-binding protein
MSHRIAVLRCPQRPRPGLIARVGDDEYRHRASSLKANASLRMKWEACRTTLVTRSRRLGSITRMTVSVRVLLALLVGTCPLTSFSQAPATPAIFIGQSAAFSGPAQALGLDVRRGVDAFFVHLNRNGGVNGRPVLLKSFDDLGNPELASSNARRLILEEGVVALIASVGDTSSEAVADVAMSNDLSRTGRPLTPPLRLR